MSKSGEFDKILSLKSKQVKQQRLSLLGYLAVKGTFTFKIREEFVILPGFPNIIFEGEVYKPIEANKIITNSVQVSFK